MSLDFTKFSPYKKDLLSFDNVPGKLSYDILAFDAYHLFYRNYHALSDLSTSEGVKTGGVFGSLKGILSLKKKYKGKIFILWEGSPKKRYAVNSEYKSNRPKKENNFYEQLNFLQTILSNLGVINFYQDEMEADDLAFWLTKEFSDKSILFVSGDADWLPLINDSKKHHILKSGFKGSYRLFTEENFSSLKPKKIMSNYPAGVFLEKVITGDASDNIKGIPYFSKKILANILEILKPSGDFSHKDMFVDFIEKVLNKELIMSDSLYSKIYNAAELLRNNYNVLVPSIEEGILYSEDPLDKDLCSTVLNSLDIKSLIESLELFS